jgi:hypothetical protein
MRFEVCKDAIKWIESRPPSLRDKLRQLTLNMRSSTDISCIIEIDDPETQEYNKKLDDLFVIIYMMHLLAWIMYGFTVFPCGCQIGPIGSNFQRRSCYTYFYDSDLHLIIIKCFVDNANINGICFISFHLAFQEQMIVPNLSHVCFQFKLTDAAGFFRDVAGLCCIYNFNNSYSVYTIIT